MIERKLEMIRKVAESEAKTIRGFRLGKDAEREALKKSRERYLRDVERAWDRWG